jgi:hypothetical protein
MIQSGSLYFYYDDSVEEVGLSETNYESLYAGFSFGTYYIDCALI